MCNIAPARFFAEKARCDTTREMAELARVAGLAGRHNGFPPARSHCSLRIMQQTAGFLVQNELGTYTRRTEDRQLVPTSVSKAIGIALEQTHCTRYYLPIVHYRVKKKSFDKHCDEAGLPCPDGYTCYW